MFGSDDHHVSAPADDKTMAQVADAVQALNNTGTPTAPETNFAPQPAPVAAPAPPPPPAKPEISAATAPTANEPEEVPVETPKIEVPAATESILAPPLTTGLGGTDGLLDIKQNALEQLKPLVDHLDSVPEEKFDALMMMIRASDDQDLIQPAYDTAQKISDDKKRAEALLDVVNEINYLTSSQQ